MRILLIVLILTIAFLGFTISKVDSATVATINGTLHLAGATTADVPLKISFNGTDYLYVTTIADTGNIRDTQIAGQDNDHGLQLTNVRSVDGTGNRPLEFSAASGRVAWCYYQACEFELEARGQPTAQSTTADSNSLVLVSEYWNGTSSQVYPAKIFLDIWQASPPGANLTIQINGQTVATFKDSMGGKAFVSEGNILNNGYWEAPEVADSGWPSSDRGRMYYRDNGNGKTQLVTVFPTGAVQVLATEP